MTDDPRFRLFPIVTFALLMPLPSTMALDETQRIADTPVAAPSAATSAAVGGRIAIDSVVRVRCSATNKSGTGFFHKSGRVITAEHVVADCPDLPVLPAGGGVVKATANLVDTDIDIAVLNLAKKLTVSAFPLSSSNDHTIGAQVTTWGFTGGYRGRIPLLSVGYLAGVETVTTRSGLQMTQWVVNAAFNSGNSGGPLIDVESGTVIGVVCSKLAPIPDSVAKRIQPLDDLKFGVMFTKTKPDGTTEKISQGRVIAEVMDHLRGQVQLVIGKALRVEDLRRLLKKNGIEP